MIDVSLLKSEERAIFALRKLYKEYGYLPFKMSKFEEYDLYLKNKDFLISDRVITFNDTNGKLLALKPDVTLSIIKNTDDTVGCKQKVYYNENVYRISGSTHQYKEIMQTGLECVGDIDAYDVYEVISLAAKSLSLIANEYVLNISHIGIISAILDDIGCDSDLRAKILICLSEKNTHDLVRICTENKISSDSIDTLVALASISADVNSVMRALEPLCSGENAKIALCELKALLDLLASDSEASHIRFDFSILNDMNYYNGIVFKGYLNGICEGVLAGGRYDKLMERMGRQSGAIGFAIYLDLLENLASSAGASDVDVLLLYSDNTKTADVAMKTRELISEGKSVSAQKAIPEKLRYKTLLDMRGDSK